ncbi:MAG: 2-polyprenyl-3-methyl-6-methoxy-1,4-benzoquinone monooxygenase [Rhodocyclaceae bacterium]|nr:2-polyprenyl-3-methyl-6-methoxy-1,4-benzoquinone monooxygenase [Rhodocyclaceae bacterium]MBX3669749.1 2-polyprenyl-3-methyl-6-methoxy-1,4-benzoquinone monooxygenase [Rhodocyclaceae bacterium]
MIDRFIIEFDKALRAIVGPHPSSRPTPGNDLPDAELTPEEKRHVGALMRVNHVGEICAQALYQGQALTSKDASVRATFKQAAWEETEHLAWTERRIADMGGRKSLLNPLWYSGALAIGVLAGKFGDRWNLGFLAETERQVEAHLAGHIDRLPKSDAKSAAILDQMRADEAKHARTAIALGGADLPAPVRLMMRASAKLMTSTAYYV